jgi:DNA-binding XRE family transcriptional regulator
MKPQTITTPAGDELVVLPRAEYDALLAAAVGREEDSDDVAIYDARKAELARGVDARLPPEVSAAMLRGDSLLKALRKWRDVTQLHLAFKTGIAQGYLSDIESGRRKGTDETLTAIAKALDVPAEWLLG